MSEAAVTDLHARIAACTHCAEHLPLGPRPVVQFSATSRIVIVSQAPGRRVHQSGVPFDDPSGDRLRGWLGLDRDAFYDASRIAIVPVGFCFPGSSKSGDLPPRPECAPKWHDEVFAQLPRERLTLLVGAHAQRQILGNRYRGNRYRGTRYRGTRYRGTRYRGTRYRGTRYRGTRYRGTRYRGTRYRGTRYRGTRYRGTRYRGTLTATVEAWRDLVPHFLPMPHPSPRNQAWFKRHPWFESELVPRLRRSVVAGRWVED